MTPIPDDRDAVLAALASAVNVIVTPSPKAAPAPAIMPKREALVAQFIAAAESNAATTARTQMAELSMAVADYLRTRRLPPIIVCASDWINTDWKIAEINAHCRAPTGEDSCGLSGVQAAAADSGAMLITGETPHELTASLLPPHHIAIVHESAIVPATADVLSSMAVAPPRTLALFCGPSRTADIEQTLTIGAHGPVAVHIIIVSDN